MLIKIPFFENNCLWHFKIFKLAIFLILVKLSYNLDLSIFISAKEKEDDLALHEHLA